MSLVALRAKEVKKDKSIDHFQEGIQVKSPQKNLYRKWKDLEKNKQRMRNKKKTLVEVYHWMFWLKDFME
jgi:uncharacterized membrane protein